tara:strand:- start:723 stop:1829 length:1107 start_codon:yes stop_codon:yes gene_type:complete
MKEKKLIIKTSSEKYPVIIGSNLINKFQKILKKNSIDFDRCLIVVDNNIGKKRINIIKNQFKNKKIYIHLFKSSEINKNQKNVDLILKILLSKNFSRQDCLISLGGGITGDVSGFAASIFKRGLQFVNVPTTLLSQVDSSIGGKTGINTKHGKNLIGNFYQPKLVLSDTNFLSTLPKREIICGYGEILKHSLIANKSFYDFLNKNISKILDLKTPLIEKAIFESCKIKKLIVEKDEKETRFRKILNFGHTFGHGFEAALGYSKRLNHGEAIILGIQMSLKFSKKIKIIQLNDFLSIIKHLKNKRLPYKISNYFLTKDVNKIISFMSKDKKNKSSKINLILLKKIGSTIIDKEYTKRNLKSFLRDELTY